MEPGWQHCIYAQTVYNTPMPDTTMRSAGLLQDRIAYLTTGTGCDPLCVAEDEAILALRERDGAAEADNPVAEAAGVNIPLSAILDLWRDLLNLEMRALDRMPREELATELARIRDAAQSVANRGTVVEPA